MDIEINDAIEEQDIERVRAILESNDEDQVKFVDADQLSNLEDDTFLVACRVGNVQIYELLRNLDPNNRDAHLRCYEQMQGVVLFRTTHLCEALRHGQHELARHLLKLGANVNANWSSDMYSNGGDTDRFLGIETSFSGVAWWLAEDTMLRELVEYGLDVDAYDDPMNGNAISKAIVQGKDLAVERLLEMGADPAQKAHTERIRDFECPIGRVSLLLLAIYSYFYFRPTNNRLRIVTLIFAKVPLSIISEPIWIDPLGDDPIFCPATSLTEYVLANVASPIDDLFNLGAVRKYVEELAHRDRMADDHERTQKSIERLLLTPPNGRRSTTGL